MMKSLALLAASLMIVASGHLQPTAAQEATPETTPAAASFPLTLDTLYGPVTIPAQPQRVVAISVGDMDAAYALGVTPVAGFEDAYSEKGNGIPTWLQDTIDTSKTDLISNGDTLPLERILALKPDIILATSAYQLDESYEGLSKIAPVITTKDEYVEGTWQNRLLVIGKALGLEAKAQQLVDDTNAKIAALKTNHPSIVGKTFTLSYAFAQGQVITINSEDDYAFRFFNDLGLVIPAQTTTALTADSDGIMSYEQLNLLDADMMIIAFDNDQLQKDIEGNPLFQRLNAVQQGTYFPVTLEAIAAMRSPSVLGIQWLIPQIDSMIAAVTGDAPMATAIAE